MSIEARSPADERQAAEAAVLELAQGSAMRAAIGYLNAGRLIDAEAVVRQHLQRQPNDVAALCLLGDLAARSGVHREAERLFRLALAGQPRLTDAQLNLARLLAQRDGVVEAIAILDDILTDLPGRCDIALMRLALLGQIGDYARAAAGYRDLVAQHPDRPDVWIANGHLESTIGNVDASIDAFCSAIAIDDGQGGAWWGLANLKTYRFDEVQIERLEGVVARRSDDRTANGAMLHFALAKALEDRGKIAPAFARYVAGNDLRRAELHYDPAGVTTEVDRSIAFFTSSLFAGLADAGDDASDPIFIVGMPRSGSTLVEQILASHPMVEGTAELPYIPMLVHQLLAERWTDRGMRFPEVVRGLSSARLKALGRAYLEAAAVHRREGRPFFIDKLPNNWRYVGFIQLILPRAKIIDTRRGPMACLWSNYRQWFARGQEYSYDFDHLARYYHDYLRFMAHVDSVTPGRVRRTDHERLLANPEPEIRGLLADLGLPFSPACLNFHQNDRAVRTASAQQVRRPIDPGQNEEWRRFEPWLGALRAAVDEFIPQ